MPTTYLYKLKSRASVVISGTLTVGSLSTTLAVSKSFVAANLLKRDYLGIDISKEYCDLSEHRLKIEQSII